MFVALQLPLSDARPFLGAECRKLEKPKFTSGVDFFHPEFLRSFGLLEPQYAPADWPAEDVYCQAARGIRFAKSPAALFEYPAGRQGRFACAFRRFLSNGETVSRIEIGLERRRRTARPLSPDQLVELARCSLRLATRVRNGSGQWEQQPFLDAGELIAGHVLRSSTRWKDAPDGFAVADWWLQPGTALAVIEAGEYEVTEIPRDAQQVALRDDAGFELHHLSFRRADGFARVWIVRVAQDVDSSSLREIRLHLSRLHAEREALRVMVRNLADGRIPMPADKDDAKPLLTYLEGATGFLERTKVYGHPQSEMLQTAYGYEDLVTAGQRASLRQSVGQHRRTLADRLDDAGKAPRPDEGGKFPTI